MGDGGLLKMVLVWVVFGVGVGVGDCGYASGVVWWGR